MIHMAALLRIVCGDKVLRVKDIALCSAGHLATSLVDNGHNDLIDMGLKVKEVEKYGLGISVESEPKAETYIDKLRADAAYAVNPEFKEVMLRLADAGERLEALEKQAVASIAYKEEAALREEVILLHDWACEPSAIIKHEKIHPWFNGKDEDRNRAILKLCRHYLGVKTDATEEGKAAPDLQG
jgi:hypothetical protein